MEKEIWPERYGRATSRMIISIMVSSNLILRHYRLLIMEAIGARLHFREISFKFYVEKRIEMRQN